MKALITGGAGFLGMNLARHLSLKAKLVLALIFRSTSTASCCLTRLFRKSGLWIWTSALPFWRLIFLTVRL